MKLFEVDEKTRAQEKNRPKFTMHAFKNIYRGVKIPWGQYVLAAATGVLFFAISGTVSSVSSQIAAGDFSDPSAIIKYVVISIVALGTEVAGYLLDRANYTLNTRVKSKLWRKLLRLPSEYYDRESPNRVISRVTVDSDAALVPFSLPIILLVLLAMLLGVLTSGAGIFNTPMSRWLIVGMVSMVVLTAFAMHVYLIVGFVSANRLSAFTAFLSERLAGFKLIKASCAEEDELARAHQLIENRYKADLLGVGGLTLNYFSTYVALIFVYIGCFLLGWRYVSSGAVTSGQSFIRFNAYAGSISGLMMYVSLVVSSLGSGAGQATKFAAIFDEKDEDNESGAPMPEQAQDILLKDVSFSYDGQRDVLQNISCRIPKGKVTALVGANGSGKSTLIKVIDRLYTDTKGELRFGEDGEILTRGPHVMLGYYKDPEYTAQVIDKEKWFHTGDIGELVGGRYLKITDRKKDIFKLSAGKYVAPQLIENMLRESEYIEQVMVIGENEKQVAAIISPNFNTLHYWALKYHLHYRDNVELISLPQTQDKIRKVLDEYNKTFAPHEQIKQFRLVTDEWTPNNGLLSPTLKLRRGPLMEKYKDLVADIYGKEKPSANSLFSAFKSVELPTMPWGKK